MTTYKIEVELEIEAADPEEADDIIIELLDAEPVIAEWRFMRGIGG